MHRRMRSVLVAAAAAFCVAALGAQVPVSDRVFSNDVYPQARVTLPGGVVGLPDLTYATVSGFRRLKLDLYLPPGPATGARPAIVYMHGGGWSGGTPRTTGAFENWPEVLASFAARGYVVASIQYRFSGEAPFPAAAQDAKAAVRWMRANATAYGIDPQRIVSWGASAGGQLAGILATSCGVTALDPPATGGRRGGGPAAATPAPRPSDCVQGVGALVRGIEPRDDDGSCRGQPKPGRRRRPECVSWLRAWLVRRAGKSRNGEHLR